MDRADRAFCLLLCSQSITLELLEVP